MAKHKKELLSAFAPEFKKAGFKKKAANWFRINEETVEVFNVQTSSWSEVYYFNVGIYIRALGSRETPPEYECHIRDRIPSARYHPRSVYDRKLLLADFEATGISPEQRIAELKQVIIPLAIDWFDRFRTLSDVRRTIVEGLRPGYIDRAVWPIIGIEPRK